MASELQIPADIFEEMAGMREIVPPRKPDKENNVKSERIVTPIDEAHLKEASFAMIYKVQKKLCKSFYKVAKKLLSFQHQNSPIKKKRSRRKIVAKIIINESNAETAARKAGKKFKLWKTLLKAAWKTLKFIVKGLFKLIKWLGKLVVKVLKPILKIFGKIAKAAAKFFARALKRIGRMLIKVSKYVFKMVKLVLKAIWKIIKKLFFRGKPMARMFKGEPSDRPMKQPTLPPKKNKMKLKLKAVGKKSSFIMKAVKKMFKVFAKLLWKIVKKVFGKIIIKIIKTIVKMIIKFIAAQVIGSLLPGIGNAIMGAAAMAMNVMDILGIVDFVQGISHDVNNMNDEFQPEPDEEEEDNEEPDINDMDLSGVKKYMETLVSQGKGDSEEYFEAKTRYLELLAESYENSGDEASAEMIRLAMETGKISFDDVQFPELPEGEGVKKLDIKALQRALEERQKQLAALKWENKAKNVFDQSEIKVLLTGEEDGGPMWAAIWADMLWYVKKNIPLRLPFRETFEAICKEVTNPYPQPILLDYHLGPKWMYEDIIQRFKRVDKGADKILNDEHYDYHNSSVSEFGEQDKFDTVIDRTNRYKFSLKEDTERLSDSKSKENFLQKKKYFLWKEILIALKEREQKTWTIDELLANENITWSARRDLTAIKYGQA